MKNILKRYFILLIGILFVILISLEIKTGFLYFSFHKMSNNKKDPNIEFLLEIYDKIQENYWQKLSDVNLSNYFKQSIETLTKMSLPELNPKNKKGLVKVFKNVTSGLTYDKKTEFTIKLAQIILMNLEPKGRNSLYTKKLEKALSQRIKNISPERDLYKILGVKKSADKNQIEEVYKSKVKKLKTQKDEQAQKEIKKLTYAYEILKDPKKRQRYDKEKIEPTVFGKMLTPQILYIFIKKFSPETFEEFKSEVKKFDKGKLDTLILDLRKNIGGSIDILPYFLGPFIGFDQYAYEFYHQNEKQVFKTKIGWLPSLVRYKKVIVLIDKDTQSTAEVFSAVLKKYNVGVLVGDRTKGWGTVERVFKINHQIKPDEEFSIFLVHSLTLRDDNLPIEGRGVEPHINIKDPEWKSELFKYFNSEELVKVVEKTLSNPPLEI